MSTFARFLCSPQTGEESQPVSKKSVSKSSPDVRSPARETRRAERPPSLPRRRVEQTCTKRRKSMPAQRTDTKDEREKKKSYQFDSNLLVRLNVRSCGAERFVSVVFARFSRDSDLASLAIGVFSSSSQLAFSLRNFTSSTKRKEVRENKTTKTKKRSLYLNKYPRTIRFLSFARPDTCCRCAARSHWTSSRRSSSSSSSSCSCSSSSSSRVHSASSLKYNELKREDQ